MIKKLIATAALAAGFSVSGCTALGGLSASSIAVIDQIQAGAIKVCGFMPTIESVAAILTGGASTPADAIISALCAQIPPAPISAVRGASRAGQNISVVVNGKIVTGVLTR